MTDKDEFFASELLQMGRITSEEVDVYVTEVESTTRFWFYLMSNHEDIEQLNCKLEKFYSDPDIHYYFCFSEESQITPGKPVAVYTKEYGFNRAVVKHVHLQNEQAEVFFCDYGTKCTVEFKDIKKLAYEFSMMEMQAIHGRLHELDESQSHQLGYNKFVKYAKRNKEGFTAYIKALYYELYQPSPLPIILKSKDDGKRVNKDLLATGNAKRCNEPIQYHIYKAQQWVVTELLKITTNSGMMVRSYLVDKHNKLETQIVLETASLSAFCVKGISPLIISQSRMLYEAYNREKKRKMKKRKIGAPIEEELKAYQFNRRWTTESVGDLSFKLMKRPSPVTKTKKRQAHVVPSGVRQLACHENVRKSSQSQENQIANGVSRTSDEYPGSTEDEQQNRSIKHWINPCETQSPKQKDQTPQQNNKIPAAQLETASCERRIIQLTSSIGLPILETNSGDSWALGRDIANLFDHWSGKDFLTERLLRLKKIEVESFSVKKDSNELWQFIRDKFVNTDQTKYTLYKLTNVVKILDTFTNNTAQTDIYAKKIQSYLALNKA